MSEVQVHVEKQPLGFINLRKEPGRSSTQVGSHIRRALIAEFAITEDPKSFGVGHYGTLDPPASGVLPLAVGKATRILPLITDRTKIYSFTLVLGKSTATADANGLTTGSAPVPGDALAQITAQLPNFHGCFAQVPPMVSAVHHNGKRLYEIARAGEVVEPKPRDVEVYALDIVSAEAHRIAMRVRCREGFYVRSLCVDLAAAIGTLGHMDQLVREAAGPFSLESALTLEQILGDIRGAIIDPRKIIDIPVFALEGDQVRMFVNGLRQPAPDHLPEDAIVFAVNMDIEAQPIIGFGLISNGRLLPQRVFM